MFACKLFIQCVGTTICEKGRMRDVANEVSRD